MKNTREISYEKEDGEEVELYVVWEEDFDDGGREFITSCEVYHNDIFIREDQEAQHLKEIRKGSGASDKPKTFMIWVLNEIGAYE